MLPPENIYERLFYYRWKKKWWHWFGLYLKMIWLSIWRSLGGRPVRAALFVGILSTIACLLLFWWLWDVWVVNPGQTDAETLALQFSFASVVATFFTVFLAGALGFFAVREFHEGRRSPDIRILFSFRGGERYGNRQFILLDNDLNELDRYGLDAWIVNLNDVYASTYVVEIRLPQSAVSKERYQSIDDLEGFFHQFVIRRFGDESQWSIFNAKERWPVEPEYWVRFQGREGSELFPEVETPFCTFFNLLHDHDPQSLSRFYSSIDVRIGVLGQKARMSQVKLMSKAELKSGGLAAPES